MCGNYLLWGKNSEGKNMVQEKNVQISTRSGTWDQPLPESLDGLIEQPAFNEATLSPLIYGSSQIKITRENFSRSKALKEAPDYLIPIFEDLFLQIDRLDLILNYYDLEHGKRKNPPREELLKKFTLEEQEQLKEQSTHLNGYQYLKKRHELVEMRRQQFTYKDFYSTPFQRSVPNYISPIDYNITIGTEIPVFPLGLMGRDEISKKIFTNEIKPNELSEKELSMISNFYWEKEREYKQLDTNKKYIDFTNEEHIYNLFALFYELEDSGAIESVEGNTKQLLKTLEYYISKSDLNDIQKTILKLKQKKIKNQKIADYVNKKFDKSYSANYISTIFRQKIIKQIIITVKHHKLMISNLWFPENFKKCTSCGRVLLIGPDDFVRKARSRDGFSNRCKICDRLERQKAAKR